MNLDPTPDQAAFAEELRQWLESNLPGEYGSTTPPAADLAERVAAGRDWQHTLAEGRYVAVAWPEEFGGRGLGPVEHFIVQQELARAGAPELVGRLGLNLVGPTLLAHGTPAQRARWLGAILDGSALWCQLFSEPEAGSDLASLRTVATRVEGGWVLNGQKVWTSYAQFADWAVCLARTDPDVAKHAGLSYFVVNMRDPGVECRPLVQITGESEFNQVFLSDVFVPQDQLIGDEHAGWRIAGTTLGYERGVNPRQQVAHTQLLEELWHLADTNGALDDAETARDLAEAFVEVRIFQLHNLRTLSRLAKGGEPGPQGSVAKLYWSEMSQRFHRTALRVVGDAAPLASGASDNPGDGKWQRSWLYYHAATIMGGTSEVQRNIIAERVLGLPRESSKA
jgi:alkylation response protein AidB-like acyl-CoA dehydrogenase